MSATTPTTKLDAINMMLSQQGEAPYNSISGQVTAEVRAAENVLTEILKDTLATGWLFNTDYDWPLSPDGNGYITIPTNTVNLTYPRYPKQKYTVREGKIYDRDNRTFVHTDTLKVNLTRLMEFEDLPQCARHYIAYRAGREYAARYLGSQTIQSFTERGEFEALTNLIEQEGMERDASILDHPDIHTGVLGMRGATLGGFGVV